MRCWSVHMAVVLDRKDDGRLWLRCLPMMETNGQTGYVMSAENAMKKVDENTIGVFV